MGGLLQVMPVQAMASALGCSTVPQLTSAAGTGASSAEPFHWILLILGSFPAVSPPYR